MVKQLELFAEIPDRIRKCIDFMIWDAKQGCKIWNRGYSNDYGAYVNVPEIYMDEQIEDYLQENLFTWQEIDEAEVQILKLGNKLDITKLL